MSRMYPPGSAPRRTDPDQSSKSITYAAILVPAIGRIASKPEKVLQVGCRMIARPHALASDCRMTMIEGIDNHNLDCVLPAQSAPGLVVGQA